MRIGVDTGGTFTDFVVLDDDGGLESFKIRSNPAAPARVILEGLERIAGAPPREVVHGSTVATNALLERKGARTAFVTTAGFEDLIAIGRQNRARLYDLTPPLPVPLVRREHCFGVAERTLFDGTIEQRPSEAELERLCARLRRARIDAVAVCLLHSYQNPANERAVAAALRGRFFLCASHEISPEFREYERASTTVIDAYVGPLMEAYLAALERGTRDRIFILQSNGGSITAREARRHAARTILSGPAGGAVGAAAAARASGFTRILGFDMGGTSTDVSLSEGQPRHTTEALVDGFPVRVPMMDIHTVGAGGGSIARVDEGGLLRVGPESAGADPGPACYGTGELATVTDAHVVLGRIAESQFLGGGMRIDPSRAERAVSKVGEALGLDAVAAAEGILRVADASMERAIRVVSIERGYDPRDFVLVAFGGCGGLHACAIATELGIRAVLVPRLAGALSALGMLIADRVRDYSAAALGRADIERRYASLERRALREMPGARLERTADLRYAGQSYEINVPWKAGAGETVFHRAHQKLYGFSDPGRAVETVTLRVRATVNVPEPDLRLRVRRARAVPERRRIRVDNAWRDLPVYCREHVGRRPLAGPALVADYGSTTLVPSGWTLEVDGCANLIVRRR
jgi:N-methylhydantoinase A